MNKAECRAVCTSPQIPLREKLFFRMIYETTTRSREVLEARYYKKVSYEEAQESYARHHPAFLEGW